MSSQIRGTVLIVDNNEDVLARLGNELTKVGYDITTTWSGVEALGLLSSRAFDSLLLDDYLPDLYIGDFLGQIAALSVPPRIILMQTKPLREVRTLGSCTLMVVDKLRTTQIIRALGEGSGCTGRNPQYWKH
jgi:CheY-like chemotaxis protein